MKNLFAVCFLMISISAISQDKPEGLFINSKAYDFRAKDQHGNDISLKDLRKKGNVVVVFYRGSWSPFCYRYLRKLQDSLQLITDKGALLVAITAENEEGIDTTIEKSGATFPIIYDQDMKISDKYQVAYKVDERTLSRLKSTNVDLLKINGQKEAYLPVPAVYIVNTEGTVTFRYFDEDYKKRIPVRDILKAL